MAGQASPIRPCISGFQPMQDHRSFEISITRPERESPTHVPEYSTLGSKKRSRTRPPKRLRMGVRSLHKVPGESLPITAPLPLRRIWAATRWAMKKWLLIWVVGNHIFSNPKSPHVSRKRSCKRLDRNLPPSSRNQCRLREQKTEWPLK